MNSQQAMKQDQKPLQLVQFGLAIRDQRMSVHGHRQPIRFVEVLASVRSASSIRELSLTGPRGTVFAETEHLTASVRSPTTVPYDINMYGYLGILRGRDSSINGYRKH